MPFVLFALTISASTIGTTKFVTVGLMPAIAQQLAISLPSVGMLVSIYTLGTAVGAPVLAALTGHLPCKQLLAALMILFTAGNLLAWQTPGYTTLIVARLLAGLAYGAFFSIGSTIATGPVSKEKAASAIVIMFGGLTVALVTGVSLGTFIGQHFGWRKTFLAVSMLGVIALINSQLLTPASIPGRAAASIRDQVKVLTHPRLLLICAVTVLGYGGVFTAFTFLAPMMQDLAGFSPTVVSWILLSYGASVAIGDIWGGKLVGKHGAVPALELISAVPFVLLMVFQLMVSTQYATLATILVMRIFAFGNVPGLQVYVVQKAEQFTPNAVDVAPGLNIAAFSIGIVLESVIGGQAVEHYGLTRTPQIGALIILVAFLLMGVNGRLDKPVRVAPGWIIDVSAHLQNKLQLFVESEC